MAPPRKVARDLRRTAAKVAKIPDTTVAAAATFGIDEAIAAGGRIGRVTLVGVVRSQTSRRGQVSVTIAGKPAGYWSFLSHGRRGGYTVRPNPRRRRQALDLRRAGLGAKASTSPGSTRGDDRWSRRVVEPTTARFGDLVDRAVADAVKA